MHKVLKTAVVGLGRIGWQFHLPEACAHEGFDVVAVVDPLEERLAEAKAEFGVDGYEQFDEMLSAASPDLVVIASPTHFHAPQAIAAMEAGADVFCNKPLAPDLEKADEIIAAMGRTGRKLMMY